MKGKTVTVTASFSITKERVEVKVKEFNQNDLTCEVEYPSGYVETLPIGAFEGY